LNQNHRKSESANSLPPPGAIDSMTMPPFLLIEKRNHLTEHILLNIRFMADPCELKTVRKQVNDIVEMPVLIPHNNKNHTGIG
jgi:hypothetical protein